MANKPRTRDEDVRTADNLIKIGEEKGQAENAALREKLDVSSWLNRLAGKIEATGFFKAESEFFRLIMLKEVKEKKEYREKYGMTWEQFCDSIGVKRRTIDEQLEDLAPFKSEFLAAFRQFSGFDFNKIKYLGQAISGGTAEIQGNRLLFDGEAIPFEPEAVQAVIEQIQEQLRAEKEDKKASLSAKDKVLKAKEELLNKQERQLQKFEKEAQTRGLSMEEDAFLQKVENLRIGFTGYMLRVDPGRMEDLSAENDPTIRMRAEYIALLHSMKSQINATYDTAVENFGDPSMLPDESWRPGMK